MKHTKTKRFLSFFVLIALLVTTLPGMTLTTLAAGNSSKEQPSHQGYGDYVFDKISNPDTTSIKDPDGINTNDTTGFGANRLNSYAWAVNSRGDSIYIGTNRTLFGSAVNAVAESLGQDPNSLGRIAKILSGGDVPVNLQDEDYIPQIIKFDVANGSTKVIYQPATADPGDGILRYLDKDGNILENARVFSEALSYRSVVEFKGNMYFGSLGSHMLQLVRVDENDQADVVFQTLGLISSLRAGCVYDDGSGETVYFGGQDTTYQKWDPASGKLPIVIRRLDPATAGTNAEDWSTLIADFDDFGEYATAKVYKNGGGNVWDLCSYNGKLYLILAYDGGWAMFRGEKGGSAPNEYGWTWTEIVGNNGVYPLAMNSNVALMNDCFEQLYSYGYDHPALADPLNGAGLLESTATPYVFNGKMYIGSFDNATTIQTQTVIKALLKLQKLTNQEARKQGDFGPTLTQIFAPIYEVLRNPQHVWVMDENENITPVDSANALLAGTTNDYVWRFIEHDGKLYTGTFDSSTAFIYFLDYSIDRVISLLEEQKDVLHANLRQLLDGKFSDRIRQLTSGLSGGSELQQRFQTAAVNAAASAEGFLDDTVSVEQLSEDLEKLEEIRNEWIASGEGSALKVAAATESAQAIAEDTDEPAEAVSKEGNDQAVPGEESENLTTEETVSESVSNEAANASENIVTDEETVSESVSNEAANASEDILTDEFEGKVTTSNEAALATEANGLIDWLLEFFEGISYWAKARQLALGAGENGEQGFDIFVTEDGENWDAIVRNGLQDPYNYGARTFTVLNNELYVGTANPYYGAQLWKISRAGTAGNRVLMKAPEPILGLIENGSPQNLVTQGQVSGDGPMYYALGTDDKTAPTSGWDTTIPTGTKAGSYYVWYNTTPGVDQESKETGPTVVKNTIAQKGGAAPQQGKGTTSVKTGDQNNALTWIIILCASLVAIITALIVCWKKKVFHR